MKTIYKYKSYAHFDSKKSSIPWESYIEDPSNIIKHGFYPFVHFVLKSWKYDNEAGDTKTKPRDINYSSHIDRYIYEYYNSKLNEKYNQYAKCHGINKCSVAYRNNLHQNNITIAKEIFSHISQNGDAFIIVSDFSKYFDKIDHAYLKTQLQTVLCAERLSDDWFKVFKSISRYSYIDLEKIAEQQNLSLSELRRKQQLCNKEEFKEIKKHIKTNIDGYGIPQGSSISATLANINLIHYDEDINNYVTARNGIYRRYCDDVIVVLPIRYRADFLQFYNEENKTIPGLLVNQDKIKNYNYISSIIRAMDGKPSWLRYLGFEFSGREIRIREGTVTSFYLKGYRSIKKIRQLSKKYGRNAYRAKFYRTFTHLGKRKSKICQGNFLSYVDRCAHIMNEPRIKKQARNHWRNFHKKLNAP